MADDFVFDVTGSQDPDQHVWTWEELHGNNTLVDRMMEQGIESLAAGYRVASLECGDNLHSNEPEKVHHLETWIARTPPFRLKDESGEIIEGLPEMSIWGHITWFRARGGGRLVHVYLRDCRDYWTDCVAALVKVVRQLLGDPTEEPARRTVQFVTQFNAQHRLLGLWAEPQPLNPGVGQLEDPFNIGRAFALSIGGLFIHLNWHLPPGIVASRWEGYFGAWAFFIWLFGRRDKIGRKTKLRVWLLDQESHIEYALFYILAVYATVLRRMIWLRLPPNVRGPEPFLDIPTIELERSAILNQWRRHIRTFPNAPQVLRDRMRQLWRAGNNVVPPDGMFAVHT